MSVRVSKDALRKEMKKVLNSLTTREKMDQSEAVTKTVLQRPWYNACRRLSLFLSMPDEIDTYQLLTASLESGKECFIPHYIGDRMKMVRLYSLEDYNSLPLTKWNIKQPADNDVRPDIIDTEGLDVILVPGLAFTKQGARLGRGKGYYDSYLTRCRDVGHSPRTVALCFRQQIVDHVPVAESDIPVQEVLCSN